MRSGLRRYREEQMDLGNGERDHSITRRIRCCWNQKSRRERRGGWRHPRQTSRGTRQMKTRGDVGDVGRRTPMATVPGALSRTLHSIILANFDRSLPFSRFRANRASWRAYSGRSPIPRRHLHPYKSPYLSGGLRGRSCPKPQTPQI
jgi:hypothetical protein